MATAITVKISDSVTAKLLARYETLELLTAHLEEMLLAEVVEKELVTWMYGRRNTDEKQFEIDMEAQRALLEQDFPKADAATTISPVI